MYNFDMGWKMMRVAECDICSYVWLPQVKVPTLCANKKCRSTLWNKGGVDGRTREARIKAGRSRKTKPTKRG